MAGHSHTDQTDQVQGICDRVGILIKGKLVACGTMDELAGSEVHMDSGDLSLEDIYMRYFKEN